MQLWQVATINMDGNILGSIGNSLSWDNGYLWHYNMPIPVLQVTETKLPWFKVLINSMEYTGTSVLSTMPTEVQQRLEQLMMNQHPLLEDGFQLPYHGNKSRERLRGNKSILEWVNISTNMSAFVEAFNKYHSDQQDDVDEQQMEEAQLYLSTRMVD